MSKFEEITVEEFNLNPFSLKNKWMLISADKNGITNTMTASWGGFGVMWNKEVVFVVIRPQRYTKEFVDNSEKFTLSFFDESHKKDLAYLGRISGRDENKILKTDLTLRIEDNTPYFNEAEIVIFAKKLYIQPMDAKFLLEKGIDSRWYPEKDYHHLYIAEVEKIITRK